MKKSGDYETTAGVNLATVKVGQYNGHVSWELLQMYNDVTRNVALENKALLIDLANELQHDSRYYYDLIHYTDDGNRKIAEIIDRHLTPYLKDQGY